MNKCMIAPGFLPLPALMTVLLLIPGCASILHAQSYNEVSDTKTGNCPLEYNEIASLQLCLAKNLPATAYHKPSPDKGCRDGYEQPLGVPFCIAQQLYLNVDNGNQYFILAGPISHYCPENFTRPAGSNICIAKRLGLDIVDDKLRLIAPGDDCVHSMHWEKGPGDCGSPPSTGVSLFWNPLPECAPGFIKPPGFSFCVANQLAQAAGSPHVAGYHLPIPAGECPQYWHRKHPDGFCLPEYYLSVCGIDFPCQQHPADTFKVSTQPVICPEGSAHVLAPIPVLDQTNPDSFATIPALSCGPPSPPTTGVRL